MATTVNGYRRLPGRHASLLHRSRLWLGEDHLLRVDLEGVTETYRRFYFSDIQAIIVRPTKQWIAEAVVGGGLVALFGLMAFLGEDMWPPFWLSLSGLMFLFPLTTLLRGATCECYLKTAVQTDRLPSLKRVRTARRFIGSVRPLIDQVQGTLSAPEYQQQLQTLAGPTTASAPAAVSPRRRPPPAPVIRHSQGRSHALLCLLLLGDAILSGVDLFVESSKLDIFSVLLFVSVVVLCVVTLVRQTSTDLPAGLKRLTWMILVYCMAWVIVGIGYAITSAFTRLATHGAQPTAETDPILFILTASSALCSLALALSGLLMLRRWWQTRPSAPPGLAEPPESAPNEGGPSPGA